MFYYLVWVRSNRFHSSQPLTYSSDIELAIGSILSVELQKERVVGFISAKTRRPSFKTKAIEYAYPMPTLPATSVKLAAWLKEYYPTPIGIISQQFLPASLKNLDDLISEKPKTKVRLTRTGLPTLNEDQKKALRLMSKSDTYLLHGRTGTGKTRLYIEKAIETIEAGRSVIILSPEIGLSTQLFDNFRTVFGDQVITIHSKQTPKERQLAWLSCLTATQPLVVIGPRSALFCPLNNLGLIVVDEMHDSAYKQEQLPHYQTIRVASTLRTLTNSTLALGSATPSVNDYFLAVSKNRPIIELHKLAKGPAVKSDVRIVDLKDREKFTKSSLFSTDLIESINKSLNDAEQSLIFLNRRGTSRLILCQQCGWESVCPHCNLPLVYHGDIHKLRCHNCGFLENSIPVVCQSCGHDSIVYTTAGTKAVVEEINKLFPQAKVRRFDTDNTKAESISQLYSSIITGQVDILIGTQQLVKGFDLPKLSTVGILLADSNLYIPDYTSEERSFQLIAQVLGRISRGHVKGRAIVQTYSPKSQLLKAAISQDYQQFYEKEIADRSTYKLPPFYNLLKLTCLRASAKSAESTCLKLKKNISQLPGVIVDGPTPSFHERHQGKYQWQLVVKSTKRSSLLKVIKMLPSGWSYDIDPTNLL